MTCVHLFMYICGGFGKNNGPSSHGSGLYSNKQSLRFRFEFSEAGFVDLNDELFVDDLIQEIENVSNSATVYMCTHVHVHNIFLMITPLALQCWSLTTN